MDKDLPAARGLIQDQADDWRNMIEDDDDIQDYVRPWVGLTEDEVFAISNTMPVSDRFEFAKAIEAKLKEKNT